MDRCKSRYNYCSNNGSLNNTVLFAWVSDKWEWSTLELITEQLENCGKVTERWRCVGHITIKPEDRAFLVRLGSRTLRNFCNYCMYSPRNNSSTGAANP